jgi:hypothetical protein
MPGRITWCTLIVLVALFCFLTPPEIWAGKQHTRMIEANAYNPNYGFFERVEVVDRKQIDIEESYIYVSHSVSIVSANPKEEENQLWSYSDGLLRGEDGRVQAVWLEVRARNRSLLSDVVWVRAQLTVVVEERGVESGKGGDLLLSFEESD